MNTKELRQKILDLAIRGKLVPQDPNDEPASVLLKKIHEEKQKLIKEGKIKKDKNESIIFRGEDNLHYEKIGDKVTCIEEEIPFEIPDGWVWTRIGSLFDLQSGKFISASQIHDFPNSSFRYACFGGNGIRGYVDHYNREGAFPLIGRQGALCGNINYAEGRFYATEHAVVVEQYCETDVRWICYFLSKLNLNQYSTATAQPGLAVATINSIPIPLPPYKEQVRIADAIDLAFTQIDAIEKEKSELISIIVQVKSKILDLAIRGKLVPQDPNDEPASVLLERIRAEKEQLIKEGKIKRNKNESFIFRGEDKSYYEKVGNKTVCIDAEIPFEIPENWIWARLGSVGQWRSGATPSRRNSAYYEGNVPWLKTGDLNDGIISYIPETISELALADTSVKMNPIGSILIAMYGATIGKIGILAIEAATNQACCACSDFRGVINTYLFFFLLSQRNAFIAKGVGGAQPNISKEIIVNTLIPLPPKSLQERIVKVIEASMNRLNAIIENIS